MYVCILNKILHNHYYYLVYPIQFKYFIQPQLTLLYALPCTKILR